MLEREATEGRLDRTRSQVMWMGQRLVGASLVNTLDLGEDGLVGRIGATGVVPAARRLGIGRRLVRACLDTLWDVPHVTLEVGVENTAAQTLYAQLGFKRRRGVRVLMARRSDLISGGPLRAHRTEPEVAFEAVTVLHSETPAFQRRQRYIQSFVGGVIAHQVGAPDIQGTVVQRGRSMLDIACRDADPDVIAALVWAASEVSWDLRLINVVADDPVGDALIALGFEVESRAWEMSL